MSQRGPRPPGSLALRPDHLDDPAAVALAVELEEENPLPGAEAELAVAHRDRLAGRPEQRRHAVRVPVAEVHVSLADVLGAAVPVVVRVVGLARHEALEHVREVLQETALELVHPHATRGMRRVDAGDAVDDAALPDGLGHFLGDVADGQAAAGSKLSLVLEDLHRRSPSFVDGRGSAGSAYCAPSAHPASSQTAPSRVGATLSSRARSSAGQSSGLIIRWSLARIQAGPSRRLVASQPGPPGWPLPEAAR